MATAIQGLCSGWWLSLTCGKRNSLLNLNAPLSCSFWPNFTTFRSLSFSANFAHGAFSKGCLSMDFFRRPNRHPVVCMAKRYAPNTIKRKRLSRKRGGDPDKKRHRRRKGSKKKKLFKIIRLVSAAGTGFSYAKKKSRKLDKIEVKKYDPQVKRHVVFTEAK